MNYLPLLILFAAVIHVFEEFFYPGGFIEWSKRTLAKFNRVKLAEAVDSGMAITVNSLFLLLCLVNVLFGGADTLLHYTLAVLIMFNAVLHVTVSVVNKKYSPGLLSAVLIYLPLAGYVFFTFDLSGSDLLLAVITGILLNTIPLIIVSLKSHFIFKL